MRRRSNATDSYNPHGRERLLTVPQSTPARRARWGLTPDKAVTYLTDRGYVLSKDYVWTYPDREPTDEESEALIYLIEEWDF